jgi:hypothetical protein
MTITRGFAVPGREKSNMSETRQTVAQETGIAAPISAAALS